MLLVMLWPHSAFAAPAPEVFGQLEKIKDASISPDGERIAVIENNDGKYSVRILNFEGKTLKKDLMTLDAGLHPRWVQWANDERILVSVRLNTLRWETPITYSYIYTQNINENTKEILVKTQNMKRQNNSNVLSFMRDDPRYILMSIQNIKTRGLEVRKVNVATGRYIKVEPADKDIQRWYADLNGDVRIGRGIKYKTRSSNNPEYEVRVKAPNSNKWESAESFPGIDHRTPIFGFSENPNELLIGHYGERDTLGMYIYDLNTKKITKELFHHDDYDVATAVFSGNGKKLIGVSFLGETKKIIRFADAEKEDERPSGLASHKQYRFLDQSKDGKKVLYEVSDSNDPGFIGMYDVESQNMTEYTRQYEQLSSDNLGRVFSVSYPARDNFNIPAYVTLPPGMTNIEAAKSIPFIILPHGGPYARDSARFDYFAQFFATRGFGVLQMNFRGSDGYGKTFKDSGRDNWELMLDDVEDGAKWLATENMSKADQTCIAGWSFGGYAALMGAARTPDLYKCAISIAGVTNLLDLIHDEKKYLYGQLSANNSILKGFEKRSDLNRFSPSKLAKDITVPVFLAHGTLDQAVHFDQYTRMKKALKKSKAKVMTRAYEGENHNMATQKNRQDMFKAIDTFLKDSVGESEFAE